MKAALKAYDTEEWSDALPTLLLGFRAAFKEDLQATPAEMVYGRALRLPGEFFDPTPADESPKELVENLKTYFNSLRPVSYIQPWEKSNFRAPSSERLHPRLCSTRWS
ncbi:hypothetical protein JTE90_021773 [Oedothorax gibbosus]|uniref:Uncharacterized protein n=1 Tax=Oedothorax gibbosus TaxID=931172 RepID=A0AAV6TR47_9ARAC|nr:hypothetical protein JTE90_021773 [Oedothorax gibbosus]